MEPKIFDYRTHCFKIPAIEKFSDIPAPGMVAETLSTQAVALALWQRERSWISERMTWPIEKIMNWKLERLSQLVDYAFTHVPMYQKLYSSVGYELGSIRNWKDFEALPIISKHDMIENYPDNVLAPGFNRGNCRLIRSSGSSGKPVSLLVDRWREDLDTILRMRAFEKMAGLTLKPTDWIYSIHHGVWPYSSLLGQYPIFTISQDCPAEDIAKHLELLKPVIVSSLASFLPKLAMTGIRLDRAGIKVVSSNSETISLNERLRLEEALGVPVLDEYSAEELGLLAMECCFHKYHAVEDDSHIELIKTDSDGLGEVIGTDMWNHAMPFIRYQIGDLAKWDSSGLNCPCGCTFRTLKEVSGRADQAFFSEKTGKIAPGSLMEACDQFIVPSSSGILEFRLLQHGLRHIELIAVPLIPSSTLNKSNLEQFQMRLNSLFGYEVFIQIKYLKAIPAEASYKRRTIINKMPR